MSLWISDNIPIVESSTCATLGGTMMRTDDSIPPSSRRGPSEGDRKLRRATDPKTPEAALAQLHAMQAEHPFWQNRVFKACTAGSLTREDFRMLFSQYYLYSKNFTRYLSALMANCESDLHRSQLAGNLWEEGGGEVPERRHAEIFRCFLREGLAIDIDDIDFLDSTRLFVREYLDFCLHAPPAAGAAFLALGTEGIVARMYSVLVRGLLAAGVAEEHLTFFRLHIGCDDEHAETLEHIMQSYFDTPDWFNTCQRAMDYALRLRLRFFEQVYDSIQSRRLVDLMSNIQRGESLAPSAEHALQLRHRATSTGQSLYNNVDERLGINFSVERVPFTTDVFDTRLLRIAALRNTEKHRHPHESIFYVVRGQGRVHVDDATIDVASGDLVFVPRWSVHQSFNTGGEELFIVALTDFGLTERAFIGDHLKTTRMKGTQAPR